MFVSDPHQADVGVGQGSTLSLVLSALYISLLMKLFNSQAKHLGVTLLSYVDDGTIIAQAPDWQNFAVTHPLLADYMDSV